MILGKPTSFDGKEVHAVAGLFKLWLRELPEPLMTFDLYPQWIQASRKFSIIDRRNFINFSYLGMDDEDKKLEVVKNLLNEMPNYNKFLLVYLMSFLGKVVEKDDVNKMNPSNLRYVQNDDRVFTTLIYF